MRNKQRADFLCLKSATILPIALVVVGLLFYADNASAQLPPGAGSAPTNKPIASWSFNDQTNWTSDQGYAPISFTNLNYSWLGDGASLVVNTNVPAWLNFHVIESTGATNLVLNAPGSLTFWFAPEWATTNGGPGQWSELFGVGEWTTNAGYGYWGLSVDAAGSNLWFQAQDGAGGNYGLSTPISWTTNYFHYVALTYSSTNVSLYLDGQLATNDPGGMNIWPSSSAVSGGMYFGSDTNGLLQAAGLFNSVQAFTYPLSSNDVQNIFNWNYGYYVMDPYNTAMINIISAPTTNTTFTPLNDVITGPGDLLTLVPNVTPCISVSTNQVWFTNVSAAMTASGTMGITFTIQGGLPNVPYDVFANSVLSFGTNGVPWAWMGQGYQCNTYMLTNLPSTACFLILGGPQDSDGDGLTDAYELLVSKSNPTNYSTDATGMADGWEVLYFGHTGVSPNGDPDGDGLTTYQEWLLRSEGYNPVQWDSYTNSIVGDGYQDFSGDGLANLMATSFGGNIMTNNTSWKANTTGDGFPDLYKTMVGLNTNSAAPVLGLPSYSKNPIQ